jgi:hypothetical protein
MNTYTYKDVSWRVHGEINRGTVAVKYLNAKEAHQSTLTTFLGRAVGVMTYTAKQGPITYTIAETADGYTFHMEWEAALVKAQTILEYTELLKGPGKPVTGKAEWRMAIAADLRELLTYSSEFSIRYTPLRGTDLAHVRMEAKVLFSSLVNAPHIERLYQDGPQRQVSIFDVFNHQWVNRNEMDMEFVVGEEHELAVVIRVPGKQVELTLGDSTSAHKNLLRFLQAIRNIIHSVEEKVPLVNVAAIRTTRYYDNDEEALYYPIYDDDDDEPVAWKAEVLHTRYVHYRADGTHCSMDIRNIHRWGRRFNVLIREGADLVREDNWFYRSCREYMQPESWQPQPTRSALEAPVLLAFTADDHDLRNAVNEALGPLLDHFGAEKYKEIYGAEPPYDLMGQI